MKASCTDERLIYTDDLKDLKEGEIFVDGETGKKYRVKKSVYPQRDISGPHGVGDPNDRSLRRLEADVLIPDRMNTRVQTVECRESLQALVKCMRESGHIKRYRKCQPERHVYDDCRIKKFNDPWFRQEITDEFIKERAEYRKTGKSTEDRSWSDYLEWKKKTGGWDDGKERQQ